MPAIFPQAVLNHHIAVLGKTGSGKTSTAKLAIEQVVADGARVCVLDPIKSDWWGMTSSADGKKAGLPFQILGGPHGHVALHAGAGKAIGEVVASGALPLSIIDMKEFAPGGQAAFFTDFATTILRKMKGWIYLVIEEAHMFAPKERSGIGQENMAIHWAKTLATAGRSTGIRLVVCTQRTQALHNALLGSCETMIAHRLTAPADQEPVIKWLKANTDAETTAKVASSLSSLKTGEAWLCSGEAQVFERRQFPRIKTYDNTATPTGDSKEHVVKTAPVDQDALRGLIGEAVKEAEANDPKLLKREISELKKQLSAKPTIATDQKIVEQAIGMALKARDLQWEKALKERDGIIGSLKGRMGKAAALLNVNGEATPGQDGPSPQNKPGETRGSGSVTAPSPTPKAWVLTNALTHRAKSPVAAAVQRPASSASADGTGLGKSDRAILTAFYWLKDEEATASKVAFYSDYSAGTSTTNNALGKLRSSGLLRGWKITEEGQSVVESWGVKAKPNGPDLLDAIRAKLGRAERAMLDALVAAHPDRLAGEALADACGYSFGSSTFNNAIGKLRSIEAAEGYARDGGTKASDVFFE